MSSRFFRVGAILMFGAAVYHAVALLIPAFGRVAYPPTYPLWRHLVFIAINTGFALLFLRRSPALVWLYAVLTLQIYNGHGRYAWTQWVSDGRIAWVDVLSVVGASVLLTLLVIDWRTRRHAHVH